MKIVCPDCRSKLYPQYLRLGIACEVDGKGSLRHMMRRLPHELDACLMS